MMNSLTLMEAVRIALVIVLSLILAWLFIYITTRVAALAVFNAKIQAYRNNNTHEGQKVQVHIRTRNR